MRTIAEIEEALRTQKAELARLNAELGEKDAAMNDPEFSAPLQIEQAPPDYEAHAGEVSRGKYGSMGNETAMIALLRDVRQPMTIHDIVARLFREGRRWRAKKPILGFQQLASATRKDPESPLVLLKDGTVALRSWYHGREEELARTQLDHSDYHLRDSKLHGERVSQAMNARRAEGKRMGTCPRICPPVWQVVVEFVASNPDASFYAVSSLVNDEVFRGEIKPVSRTYFRHYWDQLKAGAPYPELWARWLDAHPERKLQERLVREYRERALAREKEQQEGGAVVPFKKA